MHFLVADAYSTAGRAGLVEAGGTEPGVLYQRMLERLVPGCSVDIVRPADPAGDLPGGAAIGDYDGVVWTGSDLTVLDARDARLGREIEVVRTVFAAGVPSFGSCWAAQLAVVATGGECVRNPRGREFGVAREITLSVAGEEHPMFSRRTQSFSGLTCHSDMVSRLPEGAVVLAENEFTPVQAISIDHGPGSFWAVQYHPEYDLHEIASLGRLRAEELVAQGDFADLEAVETFAADLDLLHEDPARREIASTLGLPEDVLDTGRRTLEVRCWLESEVRARFG